MNIFIISIISIISFIFYVSFISIISFKNFFNAIIMFSNRYITLNMILCILELIIQRETALYLFFIINLIALKIMTKLTVEFFYL